jgi:hypothetical protein
MSICHVGAFAPMEMDDLMRVGAARAACEAAGVEWSTANKLDIVNLFYGRDFLSEPYKYDAVVLHSIFHTDWDDAREVSKRSIAKNGPHVARVMPVSPVHTPDMWRTRLVGTGARFIFAFSGIPMCLDGWALSHISGYRLVQRNHRHSLYVRRDIPAEMGEVQALQQSVVRQMLEQIIPKECKVEF